MSGKGELKAASWQYQLKVFTLQIVSGGGAGAIAKTAVAPLERVKVLLQVQATNTTIPENEKYKGIIDALVRIPQREGWLAFYRGNGTNVARIIPDAAVKFTMNDQFKMMFAPKDGSQISIWGKLGAGGASGAFKTILLYPFDIARTRLTADVARKGEKKLYNGLIDCTIKTARTEGISGVYKGLVMSLAGIVPYLAVSFTAYDELKLLLPTDKESRTSWWYPFAKMSVGATAGVFAQSLTYPLDTIRRRMQMNGGAGQAKKYNGNWDCIKKMYQQEGITSFYRGLWANAIKTAPGAAIQFVAYDYIKLALTGLDSTNSKLLQGGGGD